MSDIVLARRPLAGSVDELLAGAQRRERFVPPDARSPAGFERVVLEGERCVVKYVHLDDDFAIRASGDIGCIPRRVWEAGIMDLVPDLVDHATLAAAPWGRNGWGVALLMRDVADELVPVGDAPISEDEHLGFLAAIAGLAAATWGWQDDVALLLPPQWRWSFFSPCVLDAEAALGYPEPVPRIASDGWRRFRERAPRGVVDVIDTLLRDPSTLHRAVSATPHCLLHGDWKLGNLGRGADGRTVLLDWAYVGSGPVAHELGWYLALNRARLPAGHSKERVIADFHAALVAAGIDTRGWWERQLGLCLLGTLVEFGWEKALGPDDELAWWCVRAAEAARWL